MNETTIILSLPTTVTVDGNVTLSLSVGLIGLIVGIFIMVINLRLKSPILWLGAIISFVGVYFDPAYANTYFRIGIGLVILACIVIGFFDYKARRGGYSNG